ncbi:hypothetical protein F5I97DRAFT_1960381 [Phlebopus sp. FC_14]|nr:hypothetical protein F5I97DRAFT_1960381 [Phlebopus sp. FC_14]
MGDLKTRLILVGVGGATCSGKTTLAKHLKNILPNSVIIHQDDFAPPPELIPYHPDYNVQDWDSPQGAIEWPRLRTFLRTVKEDGRLPSDHQSYDHFNEQKDFPIDARYVDNLKKEFEHISEYVRAEEGIQITWGLVDGFLLYWDQDVAAQLDVCIFLRVPHDELKKRRHERHDWYTTEGTLWHDPPQYWEQVVYPAFLEAHRDLFENGDVEQGKPSGVTVKELMVLETARMETTDVVAACCAKLKAFILNS